MKTNVGIVTTCFNKEAHIAQSIEASLAQTYPAKVVVVDGGSTDNSVEIIKRYPVKLVQTTPRGPWTNRNAGIINLPDVEFIAFVDGDDWLEKDWVEGCMRHVNEGDYVTTSERCWTSPTETNEFVGWEPQPTFEQIWNHNSAKGCAMFHRHVLEATGGYHPSTPWCGDMDMWLDCIWRGYKFAYAPEVFFNYRLYKDEQTMSQTTPDSVKRAERQEIRRHLAPAFDALHITTG